MTLYDELQSSGIEIETELYREYSLQVIVSNVKKASEGERLGTTEKQNEIQRIFLHSFVFSLLQQEFNREMKL